jgi:hypothetical protein
MAYGILLDILTGHIRHVDGHTTGGGIVDVCNKVK